MHDLCRVVKKANRPPKANHAERTQNDLASFFLLAPSTAFLVAVRKSTWKNGQFAPYSVPPVRTPSKLPLSDSTDVIASPLASTSPFSFNTGVSLAAAAMLSVTLRLCSSSGPTNPKPFATSARFVHRSVTLAKCHSTTSGVACRASWLRESTRAWMEVASTKLTDEKSRIMARRMGRVSGWSDCFPRRGPGSFHGRSCELLGSWTIERI